MRRRAEPPLAMAGVDAPPRERRRSSSGTGSGELWRVIVLNDDHNTFEGVAFALASTLPAMSYEQGLALADRIHGSGLAIVWSGHRELAEHYWNGLRDHGLTMAPLES
jgi:ATP-dependent Clp protease adaptor protein ClpS